MTSQFTSRVDRRPALINDDITDSWMGFQNFCYKGFAFSAGRSVSDGNDFNTKLLNQPRQLFLRSFNLSWLCWRYWINNMSRQHLTCRINNSQLGSCPKGWVKAQYYATFERSN